MRTLCLLALVLGAAVTGSAPAAGPLQINDFDPAFSPDGRTVAFVRAATTESATQAIMLIDADGRHQRRLVVAPGASNLAWSPDGRSLAYSTGNIWRVDVATGATQQLTHAGMSAHPSWSADGKLIAWDQYERCFRCTGIWVMNADGTGQREVAANDGRRPTFSPVAPLLAISLTTGRVIDLNGKTIVPGGGAYVAWSPRGTYVTFTGSGLWVTNIATGRTRRISRLVNERPAWSPDGRVIAGGYRTRVVLVRAKDGSHFTALPSSDVEAGTPSWSPGGVVAYVHTGRCGIDLALEDGTHAHRLTHAC